MHIPECFGSPRIALWVLAATLWAPASRATTWYVTVAQSADYIYASGVTDTDYAMGGIHTAYATADITSPSGRYSTYSTSAPTRVIADNYMLILREDGTYAGRNAASEFCPVAWMTWYYSPSQDYKAVTPFVKLSKAEFVPNQIVYQNGSTELRVDVDSSSNCSGRVDVAHILTLPKDMLLAPTSGYDSRSVNANTTTRFTFSTGTSLTNQVTGTVSAHVYIAGYPSACEIRSGFGDLYPSFTVVR